MQLFFLHFVLLVLARTKNTLQGARNHSYISVNRKQPHVQTVANHRLEETKKALIRNSEIQAKVVVCVFLSAYVCVFSFMNKSTRK